MIETHKLYFGAGSETDWHVNALIDITLMGREPIHILASQQIAKREDRVDATGGRTKRNPAAAPCRPGNSPIGAAKSSRRMTRSHPGIHVDSTTDDVGFYATIKPLRSFERVRTCFSSVDGRGPRCKEVGGHSDPPSSAQRASKERRHAPDAFCFSQDPVLTPGSPLALSEPGRSQPRSALPARTAARRNALGR